MRSKRPKYLRGMRSNSEKASEWNEWLIDTAGKLLRAGACDQIHLCEMAKSDHVRERLRLALGEKLGAWENETPHPELGRYSDDLVLNKQASTRRIEFLAECLADVQHLLPAEERIATLRGAGRKRHEQRRQEAISAVLDMRQVISDIDRLLKTEDDAFAWSAVALSGTLHAYWQSARNEPILTYLASSVSKLETQRAAGPSPRQQATKKRRKK